MSEHALGGANVELAEAKRRVVAAGWHIRSVAVRSGGVAYDLWREDPLHTGVVLEERYCRGVTGAAALDAFLAVLARETSP